jgi:hypothetical protein
MPRRKSEQIENPIVTSNQLAKIEIKPIDKVTEDAYFKFGKLVNTQRHIPSLDGLKISYRRLLYVSHQLPSGKLIKSCSVLGKISDYHGHSTDGIMGTIAAFVKGRVFEGEGFFGQAYIDGSSDPAAAPRYTSVRLSDNYRKIIGKLLDDVPYDESEVGPQEPRFIPLPLPLCLFLDSVVSGMGVGISTNQPNFSPLSLYNAYINNNPTLLEPSIDIEIVRSESELERLWTQGIGRVVYKFHTKEHVNQDGCKGILISGDCGIFTPNLKNKYIRRWKEEGKIITEDLTDQNGPKYFIGIAKGIRTIDYEEFKRIVESICVYRDTYSLNVTDGESAFRIPLFEWIKFTYTRYIDLATSHNLKEIEQTKFNIKVYESLPSVVDYILNINPKAENDEICKSLNLTMDVVSAIMSKPISTLKKSKDNSSRLKDLKSKLKELTEFNPVKFTDDIIKQL